MNILIVTTFYHPNELGGTEVQTRVLAESLNSYHKIIILAFDSLTETSNEKINDVNVRRLKLDGHTNLIEDKIKRKHYNIINNLKYQFSASLKKEVLYKLRDIKNIVDEVDVVHFSGNFALFPIVSIITEIKRNYPKAKVIFTFHDFYLLGRRANYPNNKRFFFSYLRKSTLPKLVDVFTTPSNFLKKIVREDFKVADKKAVVLNNFIKLNKNEIKFNSSSNLIMYAGSFEYGKGIDILVKAFLKFSNKFKNYKLILIGEGYYKPEIENRLKDTDNSLYSILPKMQRNEVLDYMSKAKFVVAPSRYNETFGLSLIEGYFSGALPLGANRGALPELLNFDKELIFEDEKELEEKLIFYANNLNKAEEKYLLLNENMHKFTFENTAKKYLDFYKQIIN